MKPILFQLGPFSVYSFGIMVILAVLTSIWIVSSQIKTHGLQEKLNAESLVISILIGGLAGAKINYVIQNFTDFLEDPWATGFSGGGLVWYGGLLGGFLVVFFLAYRKKISWLKIADIMAPALALGYAIGRIGCLLAGDGDYGKPTNLPWAMSFPNGTVPTEELVHPTPIYETIIMTGVFFLLWKLRLKQHHDGFIFGFYLILAGLERFWVEFLRINPVYAFNLTLAQLISLTLILLGLFMIFKYRLGIVSSQ